MLELGQPAEQGQHQTPCAVVVSTHASPSERKPAFFPAIAESQVQAMQRAVFVYLPSMLLSGFMFPFQGMPSRAQALGEVLPLTHFVRSARAALLKGQDGSIVVHEIWPIGFFGLVAAAVALAAYRRRLDRLLP